MANDTDAHPPAPRFLSAAVALPRIEAVVSNARPIWFTQIAYLAFITVTLLSVRDLDFFSSTARISLPLVGVTIPTSTFFWTATWLAAILHVYVHLFLLKLWDALADAPPSVDTLPLGERVLPWLVVDWALRHRPDRDQAMTPRPMSKLGSAVTGLLIWLVTPLLIVAFWWRSMPAHDVRLTLAIAVALLLSFYASLTGWHRAHRSLRRAGLADNLKASRLRGTTAWFGRALPDPSALALWLSMLALVLPLAALSLAGTGWHHLPDDIADYADKHWPTDWPQPPLVVADLRDAEITQKPADWVGRNTAERRFKTTWCRDRALPPDACHAPATPYQHAARQEWCKLRNVDDCPNEFREIDTAFDHEWQEQRHEYLASLSKTNLKGRDLRRARVSDAFLAGVDLSRARLEGADFGGAWLERADLRHARLEGADLFKARLEGADIRKTWLKETNFSHAWLEGADLREAQLDGVSLRSAQLQSVDWEGVILEASPAHSANFTGGRNLTQYQLDKVIGDSNTILPRAALIGEQLHVWTCWAEPPPTLDGLLRHWPENEHDELRAQWLCPPGVAPERTGRPADAAPAAPLAD